MNYNIFVDKIGELENIFTAKYAPGLMAFLWKTISKWRESTFLQVTNNLENNFKPAFNVPLPLPAHFNEIMAQLNLQEEHEWKKNIPSHEPIDDIAYEEYKKQVSVLMKKLTGDEDFKLKTPYIDGVFCCEICYRNGCDGKNESQLRNGCPGFLSAEKNDKIIRESNGAMTSDSEKNNTIKCGYHDGKICSKNDKCTYNSSMCNPCEYAKEIE